MENDQITVEEKILQAAQTVFQQRGLPGARMQEIADLAGINKSLLHYYFRSKEKLFAHVLENAINQFQPIMQEIVVSPGLFEEKIKAFVRAYLNLFKNSPFLPLFILNELSVNPDGIGLLIHTKMRSNFEIFRIELMKQLIQENIQFRIPVTHFLVNVLSMSIFPVVGKPILSRLLEMSDEEYMRFLDERADIISQTMKCFIVPNDQK